MPQPRQAVTLDDVARLAGVAPATVSRAINTPRLVAADTLARITAAIEQVGYVPNRIAGGLASNRSQLIAAIVPSVVNPIYAETAKSFMERLSDSGYQVLLGASDFSEESEEALVTAILSRRPDALFLTGINHTQACRRKLIAAGIPIVETWDITPTPLDLVVGFSHEAVGRAAAGYIHAKGYRQIALITADDARALRRGRAFTGALSEAGIAQVQAEVLPGVASLAHGRQGLSRLIDNGFSHGAVFCSSDTIAHGAISEALSRGLSVPDDIAILGFGDQTFAAHTYPRLTTVRIDRTSMGEVAAQALLARLNDDPVAEAVIDVGFTIIERDTV